MSYHREKKICKLCNDEIINGIYAHITMLRMEGCFFPPFRYYVCGQCIGNWGALEKISEIFVESIDNIAMRMIE